MCAAWHTAVCGLRGKWRVGARGPGLRIGSEGSGGYESGVRGLGVGSQGSGASGRGWAGGRSQGPEVECPRIVS